MKPFSYLLICKNKYNVLNMMPNLSVSVTSGVFHQERFFVYHFPVFICSQPYSDTKKQK